MAQESSANAEEVAEVVVPTVEAGELALQEAAPGEAYDMTPAQKGAELSGYINIRTRSRWVVGNDDDDHDLYGVLGVDYVTGGSSSWGLHLLLRGSWGLNSQQPGSVFFGVQDTYSNRIDARVYHAYADVPVGDSVRLARLGRMVLYETPETLYLDGAHFETEPVGRTQFVVGGYGGFSVRQFNSDSFDEKVGGLYTSFRPWIDGRMRFDWMHLGDDVRFGEGNSDLVAADVKHQLGDDLTLEGNYTLLEGDSNDVRLKGFWFLPEEQLTVRVAHYRLFSAQRNLAFELNPFFNSLNTYYPFYESELVVSKAFGGTVEVFGGLDVRRVNDEGDVGRFNRDFDRYYLTAAFPDLLPSHTTLSLTGEVWDSPGNDMQTWGLDLTSRVSKKMKVSLGSYYSLYKYFFDANTEREDVRTIYGEFRNTVSESASVLVRYEYEDEELDSFHNIRLGVTWRF